MSVTTQCIKRKKYMSSLSPNEDARRTSLRKSAGQMPHYLARESNKQKGGKGGKKSGGGVMKRAAKKVSPRCLLMMMIIASAMRIERQ